MKCFSLKQPYADLIVFGEKIIELRKRNAKFRGEFLFHASKIWISVCEKWISISYNRCYYWFCIFIRF